jgi:hypothetical protein
MTTISPECVIVYAVGACRSDGHALPRAGRPRPTTEGVDIVVAGAARYSRSAPVRNALLIETRARLHTRRHRSSLNPDAPFNFRRLCFAAESTAAAVFGVARRGYPRVITNKVYNICTDISVSNVISLNKAAAYRSIFFERNDASACAAILLRHGFL